MPISGLTSFPDRVLVSPEGHNVPLFGVLEVASWRTCLAVNYLSSLMLQYGRTGITMRSLHHRCDGVLELLVSVCPVWYQCSMQWRYLAVVALRTRCRRRHGILSSLSSSSRVMSIRIFMIRKKTPVGYENEQTNRSRKK